VLDEIGHGSPASRTRPGLESMLVETSRFVRRLTHRGDNRPGRRRKTFVCSRLSLFAQGSEPHLGHWPIAAVVSSSESSWLRSASLRSHCTTTGIMASTMKVSPPALMMAP